MKFEVAIRDWLQQRLRGVVLLHLFGASIVFLLGVVMLFLTFCFLYVTLTIAVNWLWPHSAETRVWLALSLLVVVFVLAIFTDPRQMEADIAEVGSDLDSRKLAFARDLSQVIGTPMVSNNPRLEVKLYAYLICSGPRSILRTIALIAGVVQMRQVDLDSCAVVLAELARANERIPLEELRQVVPAGRDPSEIFAQVRSVEGVLYLKKGEPGLSLTQLLRKELRALRKKVKAG